MSDLYAVGVFAFVTDFHAFSGFAIATDCWDDQIKEDEMGGT
jgi:hypothetical protein